MAQRELLFSLGEKDFDFTYFNRGVGKGGQARNKTASSVRCVHPPSGAVGVSDETRSQPQNKRIAFRKCVESAEFKAWHRTEVARRTGLLRQVEEYVDREMETNLREEVRVDGKWTDASEAE